MRTSAGLLIPIGAALAIGAAVYVNFAAQRGDLASSSRAVASEGTSTEKLGELRPVAFHLKNNPQGALLFGLISGEVDQKPDLEIRESNGTVQGVGYDGLAPMLLGEMQRQRAALKAQAAKIHELERRVSELNGLRQELRAEAQSSRVLVAKQ